MKKTLFALVFSSLVLAGCSGVSTSSTSVATPTAGVDSNGKIAGFTASDVATHAASSDCWVIIDGSVYDVTSFLNRHEGGAEVIIKECGKDASTAFHTMDGSGRDHPAKATAMLKNYYKGVLQ
jgi:cytochrome b involved in lipid metabolism